MAQETIDLEKPSLHKELEHHVSEDVKNAENENNLKKLGLKIDEENKTSIDDRKKEGEESNIQKIIDVQEIQIEQNAIENELALNKKDPNLHHEEYQQIPNNIEKPIEQNEQIDKKVKEPSKQDNLLVSVYQALRECDNLINQTNAYLQYLEIQDPRSLQIHINKDVYKPLLRQDSEMQGDENKKPIKLLNIKEQTKQGPNYWKKD